MPNGLRVQGHSPASRLSQWQQIAMPDDQFPLHAALFSKLASPVSASVGQPNAQDTAGAGLVGPSWPARR